MSSVVQFLLEEIKMVHRQVTHSATLGTQVNRVLVGPVGHRAWTTTSLA